MSAVTELPDKSARDAASKLLGDNAFIEAFNGRFRAECLNQHWFLTLLQSVHSAQV